MKIFSFSNDPGVITGVENNKDLFIRKTVFEKGYSEMEYHNHPNSYEFYIVIKGKITFENVNKEIVEGFPSSTVYFEEAEFHRIVLVSEDVEMLLIKRIGSTKSS